MATALIDAVTSIAPGIAHTIKRLQDAKLSNQQIMITLLALNLEESKKTSEICQQIRDLRADLCRKGSI
jgi:uncharacterized membrane protein YhaH (DUF805 family)